jgi:hypothetical protein
MSKKEQKSISRQINLAISSPPATTEYLRWSDQPIRFSRADHPRKVPRPGHAPMVLKAQIGGYDIGRVFMDAGSGINLIYARTLKAMSISLECLKPTDCSFHGIVPGSANDPLGKIELDVCFGDSGNFHSEKLEFEVIVGVLDTGVSRSTCYEEDLLMRRTTAETAKDQKTSSRAPAGEERDRVHVSSARWRAEQEDEG